MSSSNPRVLLVRPRYRTQLTQSVRMVTEPLGLEYLAAVAASDGCEYMIHDPVVTGRSFADVLAEFKPDIVGITGYYPAKDAMLDCARFVKKEDGRIMTIIGGVHAEVNHIDFYHSEVDLVVHSGGTGTFRRILRAVRCGTVLSGMAGTCHRLENGEWICNERVPLDLSNLPFPDRSHFYKHYESFGYLHYGPVALVKTAYGCPFACSFCYCKMLNEGLYSERELEDVVAEIKEIDCRKIWLVDDTFLINMKRIRAFVELLKREDITREFIIYSRSGFIAENPEVVPLLKQAGVIDVIVGMEAIGEEKLKDYNKELGEDEHRQCVKLLKDEGIECTALFIMDVDSTFADFRNLDRWIREVGLTTYTLSVFSPYPGTDAYDEYKGQFTTSDCGKWDLSHLVMRPTGMSRACFYMLMAWMHMKVLFRNRHIRRHVLSFNRRKVRALS